MISFKTTKRIESKAMPGVAFVFRVMTEGLRNRINLDQAETLSRIRDVQAEIRSLPRKPEDDDIIDTSDSKVAAELSKLLDRVDRLKRTEIDPNWVRACLVKIENLSIDDRTDYSVDEFIQNAPEDLYAEIVKAIKTEAEMTPEERANLDSPTTSAAGAGGLTNDTTAASVDEKGSTKDETATNSFQEM